jgi:hypothetical protein
MSRQKDFKFIKHDNIGAADAEDDKYLMDCFIDTGDLETLLDCRGPHSIIVGRTGSGKTALLKMLENKAQKVILIPPESLSLSYISNSTILRFIENLGVNLDIFYRLLWRHIFTVELTKKHFNIHSEEDKKSFWQKIWQRFTDQKNRKALEYLEDWGKSFWEETEYRIQEVTTKLEEKLEGQIRATIPKGVFGAQIGGNTSITEEQKKQIIERAQKVVNDVQIRQLSDIIGLLDEILDDPQKQYYILIDRLDEDWIEDTLRYRLIRALVETVRDFRKIKYAKIIVAIRQDLLDRVFRLIRGAGFQEEKYESMYVRIYWTDKQLLDIMNLRLNHLIKSKYTKQPVSIDSLLPRSIYKQKPSDYIISRTLKQPRDVIHFVNKCIEQVINKKSITVDAIKTADGEYSRDRLRYLADEWNSDNPNLLEFSKVLRKQPFRFPIQALNKACEEFCLDFACKNLGSNDPKVTNSYLPQLAFQTANATLDLESFRNSLVQVFYKVGILGIKLETYDSFIWSSGHRGAISGTEINDNTKLEIHPAFWRVLGTLNKEG